MFSFNSKDIKKILLITLGIIVFSKLISGEITEIIYTWLLSLPGLLLAMSVHESAHAYTAYKLGDDTAKKEGRISLNPFKHMDMLGLLSLLIFRIGWGKPVEYNPYKINVKDIKKAEAKIAIAGPISNFILALLLCFILRALTKVTPTGSKLIITNIITIAIIMNIGLGMFNLIPFPPLDGSKVFYKLYEGNFGTLVRNNQSIMTIIFMGLIFAGIIGKILIPINLKIFDIMMNFASMIIR